MTLALTDFSIESENTIVLSFFDGTSHRVSPAELDQYLNQADLAKVKRALSIRKHFIKKVLPPGAMVIVLCATLVLGWYDVQRIAQIIEQERRPAVTDVASQNHTLLFGEEQNHATYGETPASPSKVITAPPNLLLPASNQAESTIEATPNTGLPILPSAVVQHDKQKSKSNTSSSDKDTKAPTTSLLQRAINKVLH